jgi:hypothetical protein
MTRKCLQKPIQYQRHLKIRKSLASARSVLQESLELYFFPVPIWLRALIVHPNCRIALSAGQVSLLMLELSSPSTSIVRVYIISGTAELIVFFNCETFVVRQTLLRVLKIGALAIGVN